MARKAGVHEPLKPCPHCGACVRRLPAHLARCRDLPMPAVLAQAYRDDINVTLLSLSCQYHIAQGAIRDRVIFGLELLGITWEDVRAERKVMMKERPPVTRPVIEGRRCTRCEILLGDNEPDGLCHYCRPGVMDYSRFMAATAYEGL